MHAFVIYGLILIGGIVVGVIGAKVFKSKESAAVTATEADLKNWRSRLASAITADEAKIKLEASNIVKEIEAKLHI